MSYPSKYPDKKDLPEGRCNPCEFSKMVTANGGYCFLGCYCPPYKGKRVAEIKDCPKIKDGD